MTGTFKGIILGCTWMAILGGFIQFCSSVPLLFRLSKVLIACCLVVVVAAVAAHDCNKTRHGRQAYPSYGAPPSPSYPAPGPSYQYYPAPSPSYAPYPAPSPPSYPSYAAPSPASYEAPPSPGYPTPAPIYNSKVLYHAPAPVMTTYTIHTCSSPAPKPTLSQQLPSLPSGPPSGNKGDEDDRALSSTYAAWPAPAPAPSAYPARSASAPQAYPPPNPSQYGK